MAPVIRLHVVLRMLGLCFFCVLMVAAGNLMLFVLPQIREALWAFDDGGNGELHRFVLFLFAFLYWAFTAWFVARLILGRRFDADTVSVPGPYSQGFVDGVARWLPRLLGCAACMPMAFFMLGMGRRWHYALALIVASLLFLVLVWTRRRLFNRFLDAASPGSSPHDSYRYFDAIGKYGWMGLAVLAAIPVLVGLALTIAPVRAGRMIGAPAIILVAFGGFTLLGGMVLTYWPRTRGWITLSWVPLLALAATQGCNDNHPVDTLAGPRQLSRHGHDMPAGARQPEQRPLLHEHFKRWMARHNAGEPVYFVATAGGASRASYWTGVTLGRLEDEARRGDGSSGFGRNIFLISSVSGGSVGAAAFVAGLQAWPRVSPGQPCMRLAMDEMLGRDALSPVGGLMLFPDLLQRFLPATTASQHIDRSHGLERSWVEDWDDTLKRSSQHCGQPAGTDNPWRRPLAQLHATTSDAQLPSLMLNTARLETARRLLQSNLRFASREADDLLREGFEARVRGMSLVAAVHNSARFPYVSPPGSVHTPDGRLWGRLGDGGYHEATGTATLAEVIEALLARGALQRRTAADGANQLFAIDDKGQASPVVVLVLDNTPTGYPNEWQRGMDGRFRLWRGGQEDELDAQELLRPQPSFFLVELFGPPLGALARPRQFAQSLEQRLSVLAGDSPEGYIELRLPRYSDLREPSMNWQLDMESRGQMTCATAAAPNEIGPALSVEPDGDSFPWGIAAAATPPEKHGVKLGNRCSYWLPRATADAKNLAEQALWANLARLRKQFERSGNAATKVAEAKS